MLKRIIAASCVLFLIGSCPPDQILVRLKGDVQTTINKNTLLFLATKSQTLRELIEEIRQQGELQEIILPDIQEHAFRYLVSIANEKNLLDANFKDILEHAQHQMGAQFESVLDMLNYLDIPLPTQFKELYKKILAKRKENEQEERSVKRVRKEEVKQELLSVKIPQDTQAIFSIINASPFLKDHVLMIHSVLPEELQVGTEIIVGNITKVDWEMLVSLANEMKAEGNDIGNQEKLNELFKKKSLSFHQLAKYLQLADYLNIESLSSAAEKNIGAKLQQFLEANKDNPVETLKEIDSAIPTTIQPSIVRRMISENKFLSSFGWRSKQYELKKILPNESIRNYCFAFSNGNGLPIAFIAGYGNSAIIYFERDKPKITKFELEVKACSFNPEGTKLFILSSKGLDIVDVLGRKNEANIALDTLGINIDVLENPGTSFAFTEDEHVVIMRTPAGFIQKINFQNAKNPEIKELASNAGYYANIAYDMTTKLIAYYSPYKIIFTDLEGNVQKKLDAGSTGIDRLWFNRAGNLIIKIGDELRIFDGGIKDITEKKYKVFPLRKQSLIGFDPETQNIILFNKDSGIGIINIETRESITTIHTKSIFLAAVARNDSNALIARFKEEISVGENPYRSIINSLSLTQLSTFLLVARLATEHKKLFDTFPDLNRYFQDLPEELKKEMTNKLKIK
ncbi:MAG TPA: hypothetical protein VHO47_04930 [Candidatus Babeliales bacterium]|nr:hypothetical protein [Candidatus Babeliales bacterium]